VIQLVTFDLETVFVVVIGLYQKCCFSKLQYCHDVAKSYHIPPGLEATTFYVSFIVFLVRGCAEALCAVGWLVPVTYWSHCRYRAPGDARVGLTTAPDCRGVAFIRAFSTTGPVTG
jgi:hypothetical protein